VVGLLRALHDQSLDPTPIAEQAAALERRAGSLGGRQDQYAAALGGLHHLQFLGDLATADQLVLGPNISTILTERFVLLHSGGTRDSSDLVGHVIGRHVDGDVATTSALVALNDAGPSVRASIDSDDPAAFIRSIQDVAELQRAVSPVITSPALVELATALDRVIDFVKPTGSGGPGNCLLVCHQPGGRSSLLDHATRHRFTVLPIEPDHAGLVVGPSETPGGTQP
jgi:D-glycero-alpha-D-manno-heptose-7-phosphate kinase